MAWGSNRKWGSQVVEWNANQETINLLVEIMKTMLTNSINDNVNGWFKSLRALKILMIRHKKIKDEDKALIVSKLQLIEEEIAFVPRMYSQLKLSSEAMAHVAKSEKMLDELSTDMIGLLYDADIILPIKKERPEFASLDIN